VQPVQDAGEPATGRHPPAAGHADLEVGSFIEVPVLSEGSSAPPVRMMKLTEMRAITPYKWVHPDQEQ
jgi:hypothetical protein